MRQCLRLIFQLRSAQVGVSPHYALFFHLLRDTSWTLVGGWGEADPARTERTQPGGRFVSSVRACAQCYSCQISDEMRVWSPSLFLFALEGFPFPFRIYQSTSLSESERICVDLNGLVSLGKSVQL